MPDQPTQRASKRNLVIGAIAALAAGAAGLVLFVLPAEFGIDPTGFGRATGIVQIPEAGDNVYLERGKQRSGVFTPSEKPLATAQGAQDHWEIELGPYESIEFKYVVDEGKLVHFFWRSTLPLNYDMHAHPFEGGETLTESYSIEKADHLGGGYVAPFTGIHGWHWENRNLEPARIVLDASGAMSGSKIFSASGEQDRALAAQSN
jgi:hypothetical protein